MIKPVSSQVEGSSFLMDLLRSFGEDAGEMEYPPKTTGWLRGGIDPARMQLIKLAIEKETHDLPRDVVDRRHCRCLLL